MRARFAILCLIVLAGCGDDLADSSDLSVTTLPDLGDTADLSIVDGFGVLCPQLAGTCVATLFDAFASCFQPAGHCFYGGHNFGAGADWQNCASYFDDYHLGQQNYPTQQYWAPHGVLCLEVDGDRNSGLLHYCTAQHCTVIFPDGGASAPSIVGGATYDPSTGFFTCADGTTVHLGPDLGGCAPLNALLDPANQLCDHALTALPVCP